MPESDVAFCKLFCHFFVFVLLIVAPLSVPFKWFAGNVFVR